MDPAIISAGVNVLGGLLSDSGPSFEEQLMGQASYQAMMDINRGKTLRKGAQRAGFNPLTYLQAMGGNVTNPTYTPKMSDPALTIASGISDAINGNEQLKIQKAQLELEKERLEQLVKATAMGDDLPGIYGRRNVGAANGSRKTGTSGASANTGVSVPAAGAGGGGLSNGSTSGIAPNRNVDVTDYTSGPGVTEISNWFTDRLGGPIVVPGADGEPWGFDELGTAIVSGIPQVSYRLGQGMANAMGARGAGTRAIEAARDWATRPAPTPPKKLKRGSKEYRDWMRRNYPTAYD